MTETYIMVWNLELWTLGLICYLLVRRSEAYLQIPIIRILQEAEQRRSAWILIFNISVNSN
jgi:hypothetical protein